MTDKEQYDLLRALTLARKLVNQKNLPGALYTVQQVSKTIAHLMAPPPLSPDNLTEPAERA